MGANKAEAISAAKELNSLLIVEEDRVAKILGATTLQQHIDWFFLNIVPDRDYSKKTIEMYRTQTKKLVAAFGQLPLTDVSVHDIASLMEKQTPRVANQVKQVATDLYKTAIGKGLCTENPAEIALKRKEKKARKRLTIEQFHALLAVAPLWMQTAMLIGLHTLQRREDITLMKFSDIKDGYLYVIQGKTEKYDSGYLRIKVGDELNEILTSARDAIASPYIVHRKPTKKVVRTGCDHWTQLTPEYLTREFANLRKQVNSLSVLDAGVAPTFHEIKALGIKLYRDQNLDPQHLAGHATSKMTNNYDSDHADIRWVDSVASLKLT